MMHRRVALQATAALTAAIPTAQATAQAAQALDEQVGGFSAPIFIATWPFGKAACERSREVLQQTGSLRDAVERGINVTELDTNITSVGYGGLPNAEGVVQLDACFMDGERQQAGAVAAIEGVRTPISVARRVMETTPHVTLAGADAANFALRNGFQKQSTLTDRARSAWQKWQQAQAAGVSQDEDNHDTIALLGLDKKQGSLVGGCSTSGLAFKLPGRVGDSPIIGSGLYVDGEVGAAGATGVGENILRYCGTFLIVEFMRQGQSPTDACEAAIRRIAAGERRPPAELSVNFVAINRAGAVGAAGTDQGFRAAVVDATSSQVLVPRRVQ